jgi:hypothetical protein
VPTKNEASVSSPAIYRRYSQAHVVRSLDSFKRSICSASLTAMVDFGYYFLT